MPDYRWGIFLAEPEAEPHDRLRRRTWASRSGRRCRASTATRCAASSSPRATPSPRRSSSSACSATPCPSLYDLRNLFQVNVEEGRHLWAMVYLLHALLRPRRPRGGRGAAAAPLGRPRQAAHPRRLQRADRRLALVLHVHAVHRPRRQVPAAALAESGFDPLSRTCRFMLTEEAHHMFVGETGVGRVVQRTLRADAASDKTDDVRARTAASTCATHPALPELLVLGLARPVRRRDLDQRRQLLRRRAQGPLRGDEEDRRPRR